MKKIKIFAPHIELRVSVTDKMVDELKECEKIAVESEFREVKDCSTCTWNNIELSGIRLCGCPELLIALEEQWERKEMRSGL